jgi:Sucrase/ferredoxin-like
METERPVDDDTSGLRCSFAAEARDDPIFATAAPAAGFLLIEQPGAWGRQALTESRLDPEVAVQLGARATALSLRTLLVKRPRARRSPAPRRWALVDATPGRETTWWGSFEHDAELLELPLDGSTGDRSTDASYLVCTHGRHDACCALRGRPVAEALARECPNATWECSHVGGDRFAGNVLVMPQGLYYGRVTPGEAPGLVAAHGRSELVARLFRGRASFKPPIQAAQHFARQQLDLTAIDDLEPIDELTGDGITTVLLRHGRQTVTVTVRPRLAETAGLLTCHATHALHAPSFALERIVVSA